jgi:hypothetical protein
VTRSCGSCTLCCKLFPVPELTKPSGRWCQHIAQGKGCGIHETRPKVCRSFWCQWIENPDLGPEWKPEISKFVLSIYPGSNSLAVTVDPATPTTWRQEPYLSGLRRFAAAALQQGDHVIVFKGDHCTAVLPHGEIELGRILPSDRIVTLKRGNDYSVEVRRG